MGVAESTFGSHGLRIGGGEALLQASAFVPLHQRGVFGGDDAAHGGLPVELAEPSALGGMRRLVAVLRGEIQTRHVTPEFRLGFGHHQRAAGSGAGQHGSARGGVEASRFQGVGGGFRGIQPGDEAGLRQCREQRLENVRRVLRGGKRVEGREHLLHPFLIPRLGAAAVAGEWFQAALAGGKPRLRADSGEHRQGGAAAEILQGAVALKRGVGIAALGDVGFRERGAEGAAILHAPQDAEQQRLRGCRGQFPERLEVLPQPSGRGLAGLRERRAVHADGGRSGALQGAPDGGAVAEFGERLPGQPLRHQAFQPCQPFGGKAALLLQFPKLAKPLAIRRDELRDEPLRIEVAAFGIAPPVRDLRRQIAQGDAVVLCHRLGDSGADAVLPSAGGEEPGAVGRVLHVVREGDHLLGARGLAVRR